jgi:hypothetical protein
LFYIIGSVVAYGRSLCFIEHKPQQPSEIPLISRVQLRNYGLRLDLMAATATIIGFTLGFDLSGWLVGAALFVMRARKDIQKFRSVGRAISVFVGALIASWLKSKSTTNCYRIPLCSFINYSISYNFKSLVYLTRIYNLFGFLVSAVRWSDIY